MIIYEREKKELIIPATFAGNGGDSDCGPEIEAAYQEGWSDGFASGETSCSGDCHISAQRIVIQDDIPRNGMVKIYPYEGCDCTYEAVAKIDGALNKSFQSGYTNGLADGVESGITQGEENIRSQFTSKNIYANGTYTASGDAAFSSVSVNISGVKAHLYATIELVADVVINNIDFGISNIGYFEPWMREHNGDRQYPFNWNFTEIDGIAQGSLRGQTLSAGTHIMTADLTYFKDIDVEHSFDNFYVERIDFWGDNTLIDNISFYIYFENV